MDTQRKPIAFSDILVFDDPIACKGDIVHDACSIQAVDGIFDGTPGFDTSVGTQRKSL